MVSGRERERDTEEDGEWECFVGLQITSGEDEGGMWEFFFIEMDFGGVRDTAGERGDIEWRERDEGLCHLKKNVF
ncbi:unnamed protein product [Prunus armeniaca]